MLSSDGCSHLHFCKPVSVSLPFQTSRAVRLGTMFVLFLRTLSVLEAHSRCLMHVFIDWVHGCEWMMSDESHLTLFVNWADFWGSSRIQQPLLYLRGCERTLTPRETRGFSLERAPCSQMECFPSLMSEGQRMLPPTRTGLRTEETLGWGSLRVTKQIRDLHWEFWGGG